MSLERACRVCGAIVPADLGREGYGSITCPDCVRAEAQARGAEDRRLTADGERDASTVGANNEQVLSNG